MALQIQHLIYLGLLFGCCIYAALRGGPPERWGAALLFLAVVLSNVALALAQTRYRIPGYGEMAVDMAFAAALILLAIRANRYWPMWAAAVQVDGVLTHVVMFSADTGSYSYAFTLWLFSLPLPVLIGVGTLRHRRRLSTYGEDPAWSG